MTQSGLMVIYTKFFLMLINKKKLQGLHFENMILPFDYDMMGVKDVCPN